MDFAWTWRGQIVDFAWSDRGLCVSTFAFSQLTNDLCVSLVWRRGLGVDFAWSDRGLGVDFTGSYFVPLNFRILRGWFKK